jgi:tripartite-type tricarboxylate transporter receptor subunit TctC
MSRLPAIALAVLSLLAAATPAPAETYPSRTITIIVPFPAGGPTDTTAREVANALSQKLKQTVIVENVTGGGTIIATTKVARANPDGYTLLVHNIQISANVTLFKKLPFDTEKDLTPVMLINKNPLILAGRKSLPANNLTELLALMKKQTLRNALPGVGTAAHLTMTLFTQAAHVSVDHIPYRGAAPALTDVLGEHVDLLMATPQSIVPQAAAGQLKAYGITAKEKSPQLPTAESLVTALGPKFDIVYWQAMFAPAGTPPAVIKTLNAALQEAVSEPALVERWKKEGFDPFPKDQRSPEKARAFFESEVTSWGEVIRANNIHLNQ